MPEPVNTDGYLQQLQALLPRGRAWTRDADATLTALLGAFAAGMARTDLRAIQTRVDILPDHTTDLITDWERTVGLPDACSSLATGLSGRRAAVIERLVSRPDLNPQTFIDLARTFGLTITVDEHDEIRAGLIEGLDVGGTRSRYFSTLDDVGSALLEFTVSPDRWRHVWWITITADRSRYFSTLDDVGSALLDFTVSPEFVCRLRKLNPAHAHLEIEVSLE